MILSQVNFNAGLKSWNEKLKFQSDYLNGDYHDIYQARSQGITEEWWIRTVDRLGKWRAYRGPKPPNTKCDILSRGFQSRLALVQAFQVLVQKADGEPSISRLSWEEIETLFTIVSQIKPKSAVFASKMCHFLLPNVFIVMDNVATQVFDYEFYWRGMKDEWERFSAKTHAIAALDDAICSQKRPRHHNYPFETKVIELCHIGYKHG